MPASAELGVFGGSGFYEWFAGAELVTVETPYGAVRVKRAGTNGESRTRAEYDDLLRIARERNLPLPEVARVVDASIQGETPT